jgi:hypothetical protein
MKKIRKPYKTPAIVYEGKVSTRAGTPPEPPRSANPGTDVFGKP